MCTLLTNASKEKNKKFSHSVRLTRVTGKPSVRKAFRISRKDITLPVIVTELLEIQLKGACHAYVSLFLKSTTTTFSAVYSSKVARVVEFGQKKLSNRQKLQGYYFSTQIDNFVFISNCPVKSISKK